MYAQICCHCATFNYTSSSTDTQIIVGYMDAYGRATHAPPQSLSQAARSLVQRPTAAYEVHDDHRDVGVADLAQP